MKGRLLLAGVTVAMVGVLLWQWVTLPDRVPGHMGFGGTVDRWGSKTEHLVVMSLATLLVVGIFAGSPYLMRMLPSGMFNMPHPQYWLTPERRPVLERLLADDLGAMGAATVTLLVLATFEVGYAATNGLGFTFDWLAFVAYLGFVVVWSIRMARGARYRPPEGWRPEDDAAGPAGRAGRGRI